MAPSFLELCHNQISELLGSFVQVWIGDFSLTVCYVLASSIKLWASGILAHPITMVCGRGGSFSPALQIPWHLILSYLMVCSPTDDLSFKAYSSTGRGSMHCTLALGSPGRSFSTWHTFWSSLGGSSCRQAVVLRWSCRVEKKAMRQEKQV
jgi:hypothetical protein